MHDEEKLGSWVVVFFSPVGTTHFDLQHFVGTWSRHFGCGQSWLSTTLQLKADGTCTYDEEWGGAKESNPGRHRGEGTWRIERGELCVDSTVLTGSEAGSARNSRYSLAHFSPDAYFRERWNRS